MTSKNSAPDPITLQRIDPALNMARFYTLSIEPTLFGDHALVRHWGRIGTRGQQKIELHASLAGAQSAMLHLATAKRRRNYR